MEVKNNLVHKDDIDKYIAKGWDFGRLKVNRPIGLKYKRSNKPSKTLGGKWMNNKIKSKLVHRDNIEEYLSSDWSLGRLEVKRPSGLKYKNRNEV